MNEALLILACVVQTVEGGDVDDVRCKTAFIQQLIEVIGQEADEHGVPPGVIAAAIYRESHFNPKARSPKDAHGLMQLKYGGAASGPFRKLSITQLRDVRTNIHVGATYMAEMKKLCKWPSHWLRKYNQGPGRARGCQSSSYGRGVVADLNLGRRQYLRLFAGPGMFWTRSERTGALDSGPSAGREVQSSPSMTDSGSFPYHTSYKEAGKFRSTENRIREPLPSDTDLPTTPSGLRLLEAKLAAPFAEP